MLKKLIIPFIFLLFSCEREIYIDSVNVEYELVVNALIQPGENDSLLLSRTYSYYTDSRSVSDASVIVSYKGDTIGRYIEKSKGTYFYEGNSFQEGKDYLLSVCHPNFNDVTANTTVPVVPDFRFGTYPINGEKVKQYFKGDIMKMEADIQVLLELDDDENTNNYYMITSASTFEFIFKVGFPEERDSIVAYTDLAKINSKSSIVEIIYHGTSYQFAQNNIDWESVYSVCEYELIFSDKLFNGQKLLIPLDVKINGQRDTGHVFHLTLTSISEEYYQMLRSLTASDKSENGFFPEALQVYGNVHNGHGLWAAKSSKTITLDISELDLFNYE
ncbi:MAG TPA: DUF4249 domain-containing protein [Prolixibacteraceae bacterium]|nr:DUF4249 domain-containing protein [Prolixibacteraceae bacterium]